MSQQLLLEVDCQKPKFDAFVNELLDAGP